MHGAHLDRHWCSKLVPKYRIWRIAAWHNQGQVAVGDSAAGCLYAVEESLVRSPQAIEDHV
jgi:hypothetical protein